jgi:hypothetical protein
MSNLSASVPIFDLSRFRFRIAAFQNTLWNLPIWLPRLSSGCDLVSPLPFTVVRESGDLDCSGRVFSAPLGLTQIQRSGCSAARAA